MPKPPHRPIAATPEKDSRADFDQRGERLREQAARVAKIYRDAATPIQQTAQPTENDDLPGMLALAKGVAEQKWPHTMDAAVWAREFCARFDITNAIVGEGDGDKESTMIGWFANAIMAGYDTAQSRAAPIQQTAQPVAWTDKMFDEIAKACVSYIAQREGFSVNWPVDIGWRVEGNDLTMWLEIQAKPTAEKNAEP